MVSCRLAPSLPSSSSPLFAMGVVVVALQPRCILSASAVGWIPRGGGGTGGSSSSFSTNAITNNQQDRESWSPASFQQPEEQEQQHREQSLSRAQRQQLPSGLNLTVHEDLLTAEECRTVIETARPHLRPSTVGRNPSRVEPSLRLSLSCKLPRLPIPELWSVEEKLARAAGVPVERGEDLQVGCYRPGHYYGLHCDERPGGRPNGGGRLATALAYLNTLDLSKVSGGCTVFTGRPFDLNGEPDFPAGNKRVRDLKRLCSSCSGDNNNDNHNRSDNDDSKRGTTTEQQADNSVAARIKPKLGRVITFRNIEPAPLGDGDIGGGAWRFIEASTHGACPVENRAGSNGNQPTGPGSEKFVVQQWFGLGGAEDNIARHERLLAHIGFGVANCYHQVPPLADLASPTGQPMARPVAAAAGAKQHVDLDNGHDSNETTSTSSSTVLSSVPSVVPNLGATRIRGWCASVQVPGQRRVLESLLAGDGNHGVAAALWFYMGDEQQAISTTSAANGKHHHKQGLLRRILRFGPYQILVGSKGEIVWALKEGRRGANNTTPKNATYEGARLQPNRWYHLVLAIGPPFREGNGKFSLDAELYVSIPGQPPREPVLLRLDGLDELATLRGLQCNDDDDDNGDNDYENSIISVGGCPEGQEEGQQQVDLRVTDLYVVGADMRGRGHSFPFSLLFYDPSHGV